MGHQAAKHSQVKKSKIFLLFIDDSITRVTIFWRNQLMKPPAVAAIFVTGVAVLAIILFTQEGVAVSSHCNPPLLPHGAFDPSPKGAYLSCHPLYEATTESKVFCSWFFGPEPDHLINITPLYHLDQENLDAVHLTNYSSLRCTFQKQVA